MFEMKDEQDASANKQTVESHLDKLDKDRKKKGLEYAVLVTLLEADNELYNRGIVDRVVQVRQNVRHPPAVLPAAPFAPKKRQHENRRRQAPADRRSKTATSTSKTLSITCGNMEIWLG
jgi:hypothetical protein